MRELDATATNPLESWRATERLDGMSQAFNVAHAASRSAPHCACARNVALPSARSAPCLPPLASGPLSEGPTAERPPPPPRSSSRLNARSRVSPHFPCPPPGPVFPLSPSLFLSLTLTFPVRYPRTSLSFSRSSPISILFLHFPLRFRFGISAVFFSVPLHSVGSLKRRVFFFCLFFVFSPSLMPWHIVVPSRLRAAEKVFRRLILPVLFARRRVRTKDGLPFIRDGCADFPARRISYRDLSASYRLGYHCINCPNR